MKQIITCNQFLSFSYINKRKIVKMLLTEIHIMSAKKLDVGQVAVHI